MTHESTDDCYKQIFYSNECSYHEKDAPFKKNPVNGFRITTFIFLMLTSQCNALPTYSVNSSPPVAMVQVLNRPTPVPFNSYKVYRRVPIASYSNGAVGQVYSQSNFNAQQELRRERYRRTMINRLFFTFDEDVNGQLSRDELYSLSLRLNIFPKFHRFLKQTSTGK